MAIDYIKSARHYKHTIHKEATMPRYEVTEELLHAIEDIVAAGASSVREMAEILEIPLGTFRKLYEGRRKNGAKEKDEIGRALKKGFARQIPRFVADAETALSRKVNGETWFECYEEVRTFLWKREKIITTFERDGEEKETISFKTLLDDNGDKIPLLDENGDQCFQTSEKKYREKSRAPSDSAIFFTLVNGTRQLTPAGEVPKWLHANQQPEILPPVDEDHDRFDNFEYVEFTEEETIEIQNRINMTPPEEREF